MHTVMPNTDSDNQPQPLHIIDNNQPTDNISTQYETDITSVLIQLTSHINISDTICSQQFTSLHSMSSIDINDNKMDHMKYIHKQNTIDRLIYNKQIPNITTLTQQQYIDIIDQLTVCEQHYICYSETLQHTVYTCIYVYDKQRQIDSIVSNDNTINTQAFILYINMLIKQLSLQRDIVLYAECYDDDEFQIHHVNHSINTDNITIDDIIQQYNSIIQDNTVSNDLLNRLKLRYNILMIYNNIFNLHQYIEQATQHIDNFNIYTLYTELITYINESIECINIANKTVSDNDAIAFDNTIALHEIPNVPYKIINFITRYDAYKLLCDNINQLLYVITKFNGLQYNNNLTFKNILHILEQYNIYNNNNATVQSSIVVRSTIWLLLGYEHNILYSNISLAELVEQDLIEYCCNVMPIHVSESINNQFQYCLSRIIQPFIVMLRVMCHNKSRQIKSIETQILDFVILEEDSSNYDYMLNNDRQQWLNNILHINKSINYHRQGSPYEYPMLSYIIYYSQYILISQLMNSLNIELYNISELTIVYYQLNILYNTMIQQQLDTYRIISNNNTLKKLQSINKKTKIKENDLYIYDNIQSNVYDSRLRYNELYCTLSIAILNSILYIKRFNIYVPSILDTSYNQQQAYFMNRYHTIAKLPQPRAHTISHYNDAVDAMNTVNNQYANDIILHRYKTCKDLCSELLHNKQQYFDDYEINNIKALQKVCVINAVAISAIQKTVDKAKIQNQKLKLSVQFKTHHQFGTLHIVTIDSNKNNIKQTNENNIGETNGKH